MPRYQTAFLALAGLLLCLLVAHPLPARAASLTCDFYDLVDLPDEWKVSMPPGFNNAQKLSLGHYYNRKQNSSVMIQIVQPDDPKTLEEVLRELEATLAENGVTILEGPEQEGALVRLAATLTGTPAVMWVGSNNDLVATTVVSGDTEACRIFLSCLRNADPLLLPSAEQIGRLRIPLPQPQAKPAE